MHDVPRAHAHVRSQQLLARVQTAEEAGKISMVLFQQFAKNVANPWKGEEIA